MSVSQQTNLLLSKPSKTYTQYIGCFSSGFGKLSGHKTGWIQWEKLQEFQNRVKLGHLMLACATKVENCCFQMPKCVVSPSFTRNTKISSLLEVTVKKKLVVSANLPEEWQPMVPYQRTKYSRHLPYNIWTVKSHVTWEPYLNTSKHHTKTRRHEMTTWI